GRGRFAPSPTGPLHMGSLVTALASFLDAKSRGDDWLIRLEDLDPPREQAGASAMILDQLRAHGLQSDGPVMHQSTRHQAYQEALQRLIDQGLAFGCSCSRSQLEQDLAAGLTRRNADGEILYSGRCRSKPSGEQAGAQPSQQAWRFRSAEGSDDFVLKRADGFWAYHLAVVVDDADQGITRIVRGDDLLLALPRHRALQAALGLPQPEVLHVPVVRNTAGEKLSKQTKAQAVSTTAPGEQLQAAWDHLRHLMPGDWVQAVKPSFERLIQSLT
ncbi:MAG: tRNA glutamyl-Q(34) synthetase GluQRS, partial [Burkholderiaceae bacterium]